MLKLKPVTKENLIEITDLEMEDTSHKESGLWQYIFKCYKESMKQSL